MKILFIHPNFPGQFKHIAKAAAECKNDVKFLCQTHYGREIEGVERLKLRGPYSHEALKRVPLPLDKQSSKMAEQFRAAFLELNNKNWNPDVIISHSGWGCGFFAKEVWPDTRHVAYLEWWFNPKSDFFHYDTKNKFLGMDESKIKKHWIRNQFVSHELASADEIIAPTNWQRSQLPRILKQNCHVIFDGVDIEKFKPDNSLKGKKPLITYGTRGMDPYRGFPQFIKSLPEVVKQLNGDIAIEIAGNTDTFYGLPPQKHKDWHQWAKEYLSDHKIDGYVKWKGFIKGDKYIKWLQSSWCHVYLTHPFIASWSFVEALSAGASIVASDVEPVKDICRKMPGVQLVDHRDENNIATCIATKIAEQWDTGGLVHERVMDHFGVHQALQKWGAVTGANLTTSD